VQTWLISTNGVSAGIPPSHPNNTVLDKKKKVITLYKGLNFGFSIKDLPKIGNELKTFIDKPIHITPPSLSGIDLNIA
jgi:hypothetical protein